MQTLIGRYKVSLYRNFKLVIWLLPVLLFVGMSGYVIIEGYSWIDAFFMVIITISTVGYGEVKELSNAGKIYSAILIIINVGVFAYLLSVFSHYIIQGAYFKKAFLRKMKKKIAKLKNHVIVCGYGKYGNEIVDHFLKHQIPFVVLEKDALKVENALEERSDFLIVHADATQEDKLIEAGIYQAKALLSALSEDMDNLYLVITARELNQEINIISRAVHQSAVRKLEKAGANHVIMPELIGGFYMATLVTKPGATTFFSYIADEVAHDIDFEEVFFSSVPDRFQNLTLNEIEIREQSGANIIGLKANNGSYIVNPPDDTLISSGISMIILGNSDQLKKMRSYLAGLK